MKKLLIALFAGLIAVTLSANALAWGKGHAPKKRHAHKHSTKAASPQKKETPATEVPVTEAPTTEALVAK